MSSCLSSIKIEEETYGNIYCEEYARNIGQHVDPWRFGVALAIKNLRIIANTSRNSCRTCLSPPSGWWRVAWRADSVARCARWPRSSSPMRHLGRMGHLTSTKSCYRSYETLRNH